jgi:hypothetical protein
MNTVSQSYEKEDDLLIGPSVSGFYIGKDISKYILENNISILHFIVIDTNETNASFLIIDDEITYEIAYSKQNIVKYIIINEDNCIRRFETPEGISIGMTYQELENMIPNIKIYNSPGFGYFGQLPSNWKISFYTGTVDEYFPKADDKIKSIYQGGRNYR